MSFVEAAILKIIGALAGVVFAYIIGKRVIVEHKNVGVWNLGKTVIVVSWFFKWGTLVLFPMIYKGILPEQSIALMWVSSFLFGHFVLRPIGKLIAT